MSRKIRILCVEDDGEYFAYLKLMIMADLSDAVIVDLAGTVSEAVENIERNRYDVCFVDYLLEGETGLDVLHAFEGVRTKPAFVFLTAYRDKKVAYDAMRLGAVDYLVKANFDQFEFEKTLSYVLYKKQKEAELVIAATRDHLTGIGNRNLFDEQLALTLNQAKRDGQKFGLIYVDIDGFKPINDNHGHDAGDQVLRDIANRISETTRQSDVCARLGGDEFGVILVRVDSRGMVDDLGQKLTESISSKPYEINGAKVSVGASVGVAVYPDDSEDSADLIRLADKRMYQHKKERKGSNKLVWA